jgi:hypothetical protein
VENKKGKKNAPAKRTGPAQPSITKGKRTFAQQQFVCIKLCQKT